MQMEFLKENVKCMLCKAKIKFLMKMKIIKI